MGGETEAAQVPATLARPSGNDVKPIAVGEDTPLLAPQGGCTCGPADLAQRIDWAGGGPRRWRARRAPQAAGAALEVFWNCGTLTMLCSALCFAIAAALVKSLGGAIPVFEIVVSQAAFNSATSALLARCSGTSVLGAPEHCRILLARAALGVLAVVASYETISRLPLAEAVSSAAGVLPAACCLHPHPVKGMGGVCCGQVFEPLSL